MADTKKIELKSSITHNGVEFGPGVHELPKDLAEFFLKTAPHAAVEWTDKEAAKGATQKAPDAQAPASATGPLDVPSESKLDQEEESEAGKKKKK